MCFVTLTCRVLSVLLLLSGNSAIMAESVTIAKRPNVVLIMADDMGFECVGSNGGDTYNTPVLDQLAASGMRF